jgi:hypothetical protein
MEHRRFRQCLSGVFFVIFALISDNGVRTDVNFKSKPTTVKTFENDSVLLPCYSTGRRKHIVGREKFVEKYFSTRSVAGVWIFFIRLLSHRRISFGSALQVCETVMMMKNSLR